jgi:hypothetical protein
LNVALSRSERATLLSDFEAEDVIKALNAASFHVKVK